MGSVVFRGELQKYVKKLHFENFWEHPHFDIVSMLLNTNYTIVLLYRGPDGQPMSKKGLKKQQRDAEKAAKKAERAAKQVRMGNCMWNANLVLRVQDIGWCGLKNESHFRVIMPDKNPFIDQLLCAFFSKLNICSTDESNVIYCKLCSDAP